MIRTRAEQRRDSKNVEQIDDRIGPGAGLADEAAQRGQLHPRQKILHYLRSG